MSYLNPRHRGRLLSISKAENLFGQVSTFKSINSAEVSLQSSNPVQTFYLKPEMFGVGIERDVYYFPFLLNSDGTPWYEANSFLYYQVMNKHVMTRPTEDTQRKASRLLDYKLFIENLQLDWLDFSGKRLTSRPTYRYYKHLIEDRGLSAQVVNQYTSDVYQFYQFVSQHWHEISMDRVDSVKTIRIYFSGTTGTHSIERLKRSQTKTTPPVQAVPLGYVRDDGEVLRPLTTDELKELKTIINGRQWSPIERLIILTSLMTGARKQTVLTLRVNTIDQLIATGPGPDGLYKVFAGPGTKIDTKNNKKQTLYLPSQLTEELHVYAHCRQAIERRRKFIQRYSQEHPEQPQMHLGDVYLFLSDQGNCYYMGKDDPRYPIIKSPPRGQVVDNLKRKILNSSSDIFPKDFYYHWLRATFALQLWNALQKPLEAGLLSQSDVISIIQNRLHHQHRETSENYLKLFRNIDVRLFGQQVFEEYLFPELTIMDVEQHHA